MSVLSAFYHFSKWKYCCFVCLENVARAIYSATDRSEEEMARRHDHQILYYVTGSIWRTVGRKSLCLIPDFVNCNINIRHEHRVLSVLRSLPSHTHKVPPRNIRWNAASWVGVLFGCCCWSLFMVSCWRWAGPENQSFVGRRSSNIQNSTHLPRYSIWTWTRTHLRLGRSLRTSLALSYFAV